MSGELSIRSTYFLRGFSPRTFYEPCIQKLFSTFQIYLFHIFYVCFFKGHGEKLFIQDYEQWFIQDYEQWFIQDYEQWFWYNPDR